MAGATRIGRRGVLQGLGAGALGLAGAALLGCGGDSAGEGGAVSGTSVPITSGTGVETLPLTAPVAQGRPRKGGTFSYPFTTTTFTQHDSHTALGGTEWHVISEKTLELHPVTGELLPSVATSWEISDPTTLVFKIHPNLKIHNKAPWNGRLFNAEDVAWNIERIGGKYAERLKQPTSAFQRASMVQNLVSATAVDETTVRVKLSGPNSAFFRGVADTRVMLMPKEMDDIGYNDPMKFGSMGPFEITEFARDQRERFKRWDGYASFRPGEPSFDAAEMYTIPDRASTVAAFGSNQLSLITNMKEEEVNTVKRARPDALLYTWIDTNWNHIRPSYEYAPFKDLRVRKAIHLSLDYLDIGNGAFGSGWGLQGALSPGFPEAWRPNKVRTLPGYNPDTKQQDRAEAAKLLEAAGFPGGRGIDFEVLFGGATNENATRFQGQLSSLYPEMKVQQKSVDSAAFATAQAAGNFKSVSYTITAAPDAVIDMASNYRTGGSRNYGKFSNTELDALLDKAQAELDTQKRTELFETFQQRFQDDWMPMWVLHAWATRDMVQSNIGGFDKLAGTWFGYAWYTKWARLTLLDK